MSGKFAHIVKRTRDELAAMPKPCSPAELEILSRWYFGAPLHFAQLWVTDSIPSSAPGNAGTAQYRVAERYDDYHGDGWLHDKSCIKGYDYSRDFWIHVIGHLYCGGIASCSYGQAYVRGHRDVARLKEFEGYVLRKETGRLRKQFQRLALKHGEGESTANRDSCALMTGRVDGAVAVYSAGGAA